MLFPPALPYSGTDDLQLSAYHPVIGMCLLALISLQPLMELSNHFLHERYEKVELLGYPHVWLGRILLLVGIINGGLGFHFAESFGGPQPPAWPKIVYGVIATVVFILYVAIVVVWLEIGRDSQALRANASEAEIELHDVESAIGAATTTGVNADDVSDVKNEAGAKGGAPIAQEEAKKAFRSSAL